MTTFTAKSKTWLWVDGGDQIHRNPGIQIMSADNAILERVNELFYLELAEDFKKLHGFHQGVGQTWLYKEFWTSNQSAVLELAEKLAKFLDVELHTDTPPMAWILANKM